MDSSLLVSNYLSPAMLGVGRGWRIAPEHFAERHGLIILIVLGISKFVTAFAGHLTKT
jgi:low temperature requirement protein LtrA